MNADSRRYGLETRQGGFSLIELLLVAAIIGILAVVVIPRAQRAGADARYNLVRQAAMEISSWGLEWTQRLQESQDVMDSCNMNNYLATLVGYTGDKSGSNWSGAALDLTNSGECRNRDSGHSGRGISYPVSDIMPDDQRPRNPFTGTDYMSPSNDGTGPLVPGLLYLASDKSTEYHEYYFVYTGNDSTNNQDFHAGMGSIGSMSLGQLRNGVFVARLKP